MSDFADSLAAALADTRRGWAVLPIWWIDGSGRCACGKPNDAPRHKPGKHPIGKPDAAPHGVKNATTDEATIRRWVERYPRMNLAIACGAVSGGIVGIDVDPQSGGAEALAELEARHGPLPRTPTNLTGGGGAHYLVHADDATRAILGGKLGLGIDIKSDGGYLLVPPSRHVSGRGYEWDAAAHPDDIQLAELPAWVVEESRVTRKSKSAETRSGAVLANHPWQASVIGTLINKGVPADQAKVIVAKAVAELAPPHSDGTPYTEEEALALAEDLYRRYSNEANGLAKPERKSVAVILAELANDVELFHDADGRAFATVRSADHRETYAVRSKPFREWLEYRLWTTHPDKSAGGEAMESALRRIEARARFEGDEHPVHVRVAMQGNALYLDLANDVWEVVEITVDGWRIVSDPPVKFWRPNGLRPLPTPIRDGSVDELRPLVNIGTDDNWHLLIGYVVGALQPGVRYPILIPTGEHDTAKSTLTRMIRRLIDPHAAELRAPARNADDLMIACRTGWIVAFDNVSQLHDWQSDAFCRISTGGALTKREHYSNADEIILTALQPLIVNGIGDFAEQPDLRSRAIMLELPLIASGKRKGEVELWTKFESVAPRVLGAILSAASSALANRDSVQIQTDVRMADFTRWVTAAEPALGWAPGSFARAYERNRGMIDALALESNLVAAEIMALMASRHEWQGTATELLSLLNQVADERIQRAPRWPKSAGSLGKALVTVAPILRAAGIDFGHDNSNKRRREIVLRNLQLQPSEPSDSSDNSLPMPTGPTDGPTAPTGAMPSTSSDTDTSDGSDGLTLAFSSATLLTEDDGAHFRVPPARGRV